MHCFIQFPRLLSLARLARLSSSPTSLSKALTLASSLWRTSQTPHLTTFLSQTTSPLPVPATHSLSDLVPSLLSFDSIANLMLLLHHWMLTVSLCGVVQTLHRRFPTQTAQSALPPLHMVQKVDAEAATGIAQAVVYALSGKAGAALPMTLFRIVSPFQTSVGAWLRACLPAPVPHTTPLGDQACVNDISLAEAYVAADAASQARRMVDWVVEEGRRVSERWGLPVTERAQLERAQEWVGGGVEWHGLEMVHVEGLRDGWKKGEWSRCRREGRSWGRDGREVVG